MVTIYTWLQKRCQIKIEKISVAAQWNYGKTTLLSLKLSFRLLIFNIFSNEERLRVYSIASYVIIIYRIEAHYCASQKTIGWYRSCHMHFTWQHFFNQMYTRCKRPFHFEAIISQFHLEHARNAKLSSFFSSALFIPFSVIGFLWWFVLWRPNRRLKWSF